MTALLAFAAYAFLAVCTGLLVLSLCRAAEPEPVVELSEADLDSLDLLDRCEEMWARPSLIDQDDIEGVAW